MIEVDEATLRTGPEGPVSSPRTSRTDAPSPSSVTSFYNERPPQWNVARERAEHRIAVLLKLQGFTIREIASQLEMTPIAVSNALRQQWARDYMLETLERTGGKRVERLLAGEVINNIETLIEVRDSAPRPSDRASAANSLLDRYLGKPKERVEIDERPATSLAEVDAQLEQLRQEQAALLGTRLERQ